MAGAHAKNTFKDLVYRFYRTYIPNRSDRPVQIIVKLIAIISIILLIGSSAYLIFYFSTAKTQRSIIDDTRATWYNEDIAQSERFTELSAANPDFRAWLTVGGTQIDNPVYQADDDDYYLDHNQNREISRYGALFLSADDRIDSKSDKNLVIYGHNMRDGSMFGTLKSFRNLSFYKQNPTITLSSSTDESVYLVFSVFLLNGKKEDDNNYLYNFEKSSFNSSADFDNWVNEAFDRSLINTGVDVSYGDDILTLITCTSDFRDARLIVMAKKLRRDEINDIDTAGAVVNGYPRHPKRWYDERKLEYPY